MTRNTGAPAFIHGNLEITVLEDQALAVGIADLNATDPDSVSSILKFVIYGIMHSRK